MKILHSPHLFNLIAFLAVLSAIVTLALAGKPTDLAIMTGLVGILGSFRPWGATPAKTDEGPTGAPDDPLSVAGPETTSTAPPVQTETTDENAPRP
ncbi:hypothetical protein [Phenylobacterium sp.]|uniref:hypothetical protein n=1 Tax=Phenylobacterium sp. TaxID=1871053 RepID=UPI00286A3F08|nr:hypothetical protein [Phenylobacterium sp.]